MEEMITILEFSACGNNQSANKLRFTGEHDIRIILAIRKMLEKKKWDIISVRELPYLVLKKLAPELESVGYRMVIDPIWGFVQQKWLYSCLSVVFIRKSIKFTQ